MVKLSRISFGGTAAIVTSMAFVIGLNAAAASKNTIMGALLISALADNLTDSLSVHIYQESEQLDEHEAFTGTITNFATRFGLCLSFVFIVAAFPISIAIPAVLFWGMVLLASLSYGLARERSVSAMSEVIKHLFTASIVIFVSRVIGFWLSKHIAA